MFLVKWIEILLTGPGCLVDKYHQRWIRDRNQSCHLEPLAVFGRHANGVRDLQKRYWKSARLARVISRSSTWTAATAETLSSAGKGEGIAEAATTKAKVTNDRTLKTMIDDVVVWKGWLRRSCCLKFLLMSWSFLERIRPVFIYFCHVRVYCRAFYFHGARQFTWACRLTLIPHQKTQTLKRKHPPQFCKGRRWLLATCFEKALGAWKIHNCSSGFSCCLVWNMHALWTRESIGRWLFDISSTATLQYTV
jgi:hypothetical protein